MDLVSPVGDQGHVPPSHSGISCSPMALWSSAHCGSRTLAATAVVAPGQTRPPRRSSCMSQVCPHSIYNGRPQALGQEGPDDKASEGSGDPQVSPPHTSPCVSSDLLLGGDVTMPAEAEAGRFPQARDPAQGHRSPNSGLGGDASGQRTVPSSHPQPATR